MLKRDKLQTIPRLLDVRCAVFGCDNPSTALKIIYGVNSNDYRTRCDWKLLNRASWEVAHQIVGLKLIAANFLSKTAKFLNPGLEPDFEYFFTINQRFLWFQLNSHAQHGFSNKKIMISRVTYRPSFSVATLIPGKLTFIQNKVLTYAKKYRPASASRSSFMFHTSSS